jgi:hypothetical protein
LTAGNHQSEPPAGSKRRKHSRRRWIWRTSLRLLVTLLLIAGGAIAILSFIPISSPWLDRQIRERWIRATGLELDYSHAEVTPVTGLIQVIAPRLIDPESSETLATLSALDVRIDVVSVLSALITRDAPAHIRRIGVQGPLELHFEEEQGRVNPSPRLQRLVAIVREHLGDDRGTDGPAIDIESISLSGADLYLDRLDSGERTPLLTIADTFLLGEFERGRTLPKHVNLVGRLVGRTGSTGISLRLVPNEREEEMRLKLRLNPLDTRANLQGQVPMDFQTGEVSMEGLIRRQAPGDWILRTETRTPRVSLIGAGVHGVDHRFDDAMIDTWLRWRNEDKRLDLLGLWVTTRDCDLEARGDLNLAEPYDYRLEVADLELRGQAVALTERIVFGENRITTPNRGTLRVVGQLDGMATAIKPERVTGEFSLEDLTLSLPNLPEPVQGVRVQAEIAQDHVRLIEAAAMVQGLPIFVRGEMSGEPLNGRIASAQFDWRVSGELDGLTGLIDARPAAADWQVAIRGGVSGGGTIEVDEITLEHWGQMMETARINGRLVFNQAEVSSNRLKRPIRDLRGSLDFDRNRATLTDLAGSIEDVQFEMDGAIEGETVFWKESLLDVELRADFSLERLEEYYTWADRIPPRMPERGGRVQLQGRLRGPVSDLASAELSGTLLGTDVYVRPEGPRFGDMLRFSQVDITLERSRAAVSRTLGRWGEIDLQLEGELTPAGGRLRAVFEGELDRFAPLIPKVASEFESLGGRVVVSNHIELARVESAPTAVTLLDLWAEMGSAAGTEAVTWEDRWAIDLDGEVKVDGGRLRYMQMPDTALLSEITGVLKFTLDECWSEESVQLKPGVHAEMARTTARIRYPRDKPKTLSLSFDLRGTHVDLDDWIEGWKKRKPRPPADQPRKPLDFDLELDVVSERVGYRGLVGQDLTGRLTFESHGKNQDTLVWEDARAYFKDGHVVVNGRVAKRGDVKTIEHRIEATDIEVADVTQAFLKKQGMISSGRVTGNMAILSEGGEDAKFNGGGEFRVNGSRFVSNAIFRRVGSLLKLDTLFNDISFTRIEGGFRMEEGVILLDRGSPVVFENPSALHPLSLTASGRIEPDQEVDLLLSLQFFPIVGNIPLVGDVWNALTGRIIRVDVKGPLDDPKVFPAAPVI